jgi:putative ABC transport system substrate-binding protein
LADDSLDRRRFVALLAAAAAAAPTAAQAAGPMRRIGVMMAFAETDREGQYWANAFIDGLKTLGWSEGRNASFDWRWANGDVGQMAIFASELVGLKPDVILASSSPVLAALMKATSEIPLAFVSVSNPVDAGFVRSLARPGGNVTGLANYEGEIASKWLAQLKEISPATARVGVLLHPEAPAHAAYWRDATAAASSLKITLTPIPFRTPADIERGLTALAGEPGSGVLVLANILATANRRLIIDLAARHRMPAIYPFRVFVSDGGLISYGIDLIDSHRRVASYVDEILRGSPAAGLQVQMQTKFSLAINLATARMLKLGVPPTLIATADEVVE